MAKIYNSVNDPQSQAGLLARNLYTSEQIEYKLRQKADKTLVYSKQEIDTKLVTLTNLVINAENTFLGFSFYLDQSDTKNFPLKWNGSRFLSCLSSSIPNDGISPLPLGWNPSTYSLTSLFPTLDSGSDRDSNNPGLYLGRQTIINGGVFNLDPLSEQQDSLLSEYPIETYSGSNFLWKQFEPNNRLIIKHSIDGDNNSLGPNSLYTGELAININTGDVFIGWEGKSQNTLTDMVLDGVKKIFSPKDYLKLNPANEQTLQAGPLSNIPSLMVKGSICPLGSEEGRADIAQFYTKDGYKKVSIDRLGVLNTESLNINVTPISTSSSSTHKIPIKVMGQTYYLLLSNV